MKTYQITVVDFTELFDETDIDADEVREALLCDDGSHAGDSTLMSIEDARMVFRYKSHQHEMYGRGVNIWENMVGMLDLLKLDNPKAFVRIC